MKKLLILILGTLIGAVGCFFASYYAAQSGFIAALLLCFVPLVVLVFIITVGLQLLSMSRKNFVALAVTSVLCVAICCGALTALFKFF